MKKSIVINLTSIAILLASSISLSFIKPGKPKKELVNGIQWSEITHNFGDIKIGPDATAVFKFKNKKKSAIKLKSVEPGCSCTVSSFTSEEIKKNKMGEVTATYRTKDKPGFFKKFVHVTFEDGSTQELVITGNVLP